MLCGPCYIRPKWAVFVKGYSNKVFFPKLLRVRGVDPPNNLYLKGRVVLELPQSRCRSTQTGKPRQLPFSMLGLPFKTRTIALLAISFGVPAAASCLQIVSFCCPPFSNLDSALSFQKEKGIL
jgi:hypothetical protein